MNKRSRGRPVRQDEAYALTLSDEHIARGAKYLTELRSRMRHAALGLCKYSTGCKVPAKGFCPEHALLRNKLARQRRATKKSTSTKEIVG